MNNKIYTAYDNECMLYLALGIYEIWHRHIYIDLYVEEIKKIYEDYKQYDNPEKSLYDSICDYINNNLDSLKERLNEAFDGAF